MVKSPSPCVRGSGAEVVQAARPASMAAHRIMYLMDLHGEFNQSSNSAGAVWIFSAKGRGMAQAVMRPSG